MTNSSRASPKWQKPFGSATASIRKQKWVRSSHATTTRVLDYIRIGNEERSHPVAGGKAPDGPLADGFFVEPTVFADVTTRCGSRGKRFSARSPASSPSKISRSHPEGQRHALWPRCRRVDPRLAQSPPGRRRAGCGTVWVNCYNAFETPHPGAESNKAAGVAKKVRMAWICSPKSNQ